MIRIAAVGDVHLGPDARGALRPALETLPGHADILLLAGLDSDVRIALTHYAPVKDTLRGEPPEIYPFLGSYLLGAAIDAAGADLAVHGHAHFGTEQGVTPCGVRVRNVAQPVIGAAFHVYTLPGGHEPGHRLSHGPNRAA